MAETEWKFELDQLKALVVNEPLNGEAYYQLARFYNRKCNNPQRALTAYQKAQQLLPEQDLQLFIGKGLCRTGKYDEGIDLLNKYVTENQFAHGHCMLADCLMIQDRFDEAILNLDKAIALDPLFEESYFLMGEALKNVIVNRQ